MRRKIPVLIVAAAAAAALWLGFGAVRRALAPTEWLAAFARNPFGLTSRTAPSGPVLLEQIQRLQRLETCRYNGQVIVRGDTSGILPAWLAGDRLLFVGRGEVVAGVDLAQIKPEDVRVDGSRVALKLPGAEILHTGLDNRRSEVYERQSGIFTGPDRTLETRVRTEAEERLQAAAVESGVLDTAAGNARDTLRKQMELLGFREVSFI